MNYSTIRSIFIGGAVAHSAIFTRRIDGTVTAETEKAIQFTMNDRRGSVAIWFPKRAIVAKSGKYDTLYSLAAWFTPSEFQYRMIERYQEIGGVSAA